MLRRALVVAASLALACQANDPPPAPAPPRPLALPSRAPEPPPPAPPAPPARPPATVRAGVAAGVTYLEVVTGAAADDARLPWVVAMHGLGDTSADFIGLYRDLAVPARVFALQGIEPFGPGWQWFPPGDADRLPAAFRAATSRVVSALRELASTRPVCGHPVATGFSQGAMMTWSLAAQRPAVILGAVPIAGRLPSAFWPTARGTAWPEVVAIHGSADQRIPYDEDVRTADAFRRVGATATLERFVGVGHTVSPEMRRSLFDALARMLARADCAAR